MSTRASFSVLALGLLAACGSSVVEDGDTDGGGGSGAGNEGGSGGEIIIGDPCEGLSCGDPCTTCPEGAPCIPQACDASGECVAEELASCSPCPASLPEPQSGCATLNLQCEYDDGVVLSCRTRASCTASGWEIYQVDCTSDPPPDPACPEAAPSGGCSVDTDPGLCVYDATLCGCSDCGFGGPCGGDAMWACAPPPDPPCPEIAARLGQPCENEGLTCVYGSCALGSVSGGRTCQGGLWVEEGIACPL